MDDAEIARRARVYAEAWEEMERMRERDPFPIAHSPQQLNHRATIRASAQRAHDELLDAVRRAT